MRSRGHILYHRPRLGTPPESGGSTKRTSTEPSPSLRYHTYTTRTIRSCGFLFFVSGFLITKTEKPSVAGDNAIRPTYGFGDSIFNQIARHQMRIRHTMLDFWPRQISRQVSRLRRAAYALYGRGNVPLCGERDIYDGRKQHATFDHIYPPSHHLAFSLFLVPNYTIALYHRPFYDYGRLGDCGRQSEVMPFDGVSSSRLWLTAKSASPTS